ncbi:MAG: TonB-dependent receptor, partial [Sphingomonas hengshuiensis]
MYRTTISHSRANGLARQSLSVGLRALALGLMATTASTAWAQAAPAAEEPADAEAATKDDVVVIGFRRSLESATNTKKQNDQILESVTAEDIGKLPDASIAESIARLPGLTSQRLNGRANVISIRGLGPDLSTTLLNGREQTSTGDARAVEFDQYPSEVINQVVVYKSPIASLIGQGLAGTVDIRTIRPLDTKKRVIALGARGVDADLGRLNAGSQQFGYRVNGTYVDRFLNDTLGLALAASYVDEPYQIQEFNAWGYAGNGTAASPSLIGGNRSFVRSTQLRRFGFVGTVQWQPRPELTLTADGFYSDFR